MATRIKKTDFPFPIFSTEADRDYLLARHTNFLGPGFHSRTGFFAQQACEKYMKAVSVQARSEYLETHILLQIAEFCSDIDPFFADPSTKTTLEIFDNFEQVGRYGVAANYDPLAIETEQFRTAGIAVWQQNYLNLLDAFVFKVHSMLNYEKANYVNSIKAILENNRNEFLTGTWRGRPPLRVVLTKQNRYFIR